MRKYKNVSGKTFGNLTVITMSNYIDKKRRKFWICRCKCGKLIRVRGDHLRLGHSTQCSVCGGGGKPSHEVGGEYATL